MTEGKKRNDVNAPGAIASAVIINSVGGFFYNVMPTFLGSLADSVGFNEQQLGFIASAFLLGSVLLATSGIFWMRQISWRRSLTTAFILIIIAYLSCLFTNSFTSIVTFMFIAGCGNGVCYSIALLSISDTEKTERNFGFCIIVGVSLAAVGLYAFPLVNQFLGFTGVMGTLIAITLLVIIFLPWFPDYGTKGPKKEESNVHEPVYPVFIGIGAMFFLYMGLSGIWAFLGRIADIVGIDATSAGSALAIGMVLGAIGAFLASIIGNSFGKIKPIFWGTLCIIISIIFIANLKGLILFMIAALMLQSAWNFALPFQLSAISDSDKSGRFVPLITTAMGGGATAGPAIAGGLIVEKGYGTLCLFSIFIIALSFAAFSGLEIINLRNKKNF